MRQARNVPMAAIPTSIHMGGRERQVRAAESESVVCAMR